MYSFLPYTEVWLKEYEILEDSKQGLKFMIYGLWNFRKNI